MSTVLEATTPVVAPPAPKTYMEKLALSVNMPVGDVRIECRKTTSFQSGYQGVFNVYGSGNKRIAWWTLIAQPGCCGTIISTASGVAPEFHKRGIGTFLNLLRQKICIEWGYSLMVATDLTNNKKNRSILDRTGWKQATEFKNSRTSNKVSLYFIDIHVKKMELNEIPLGIPTPIPV